MIQVRKQKVSRIRQGDIFKDIEFVEHVTEKSGVLEVSKIVFPLVVVLTQDCDLEQDYKARWSHNRPTTEDKWLLSVLVAPLYNAEQVYLGDHLGDLGMRMQAINKKKSPGKRLRKNEVPRYHFLEFRTDINIVPSVADFKHYFSVNVNYLKAIKATKFVCNVAPLFREDLLQRFSAFLARIALPEIN